MSHYLIFHRNVTQKAEVVAGDVDALRRVCNLMIAKADDIRVYRVDHGGNTHPMNIRIESDRFELVPSVRIHRPTGQRTVTKQQWSAMQGWITKWRTAANFWEEEARRLGSTADYKINHRVTRAPEGEAEQLELE